MTVTALTPRQKEAARTPYKFEGKEVSLTRVKVMSAASLDVEDRVFPIDDFVELRVIGRVSNVHHKVNEKTGVLERIHDVKVIEAEFTHAWSPEDGEEYR